MTQTSNRAQRRANLKKSSQNSSTVSERNIANDLTELKPNLTNLEQNLPPLTLPFPLDPQNLSLDQLTQLAQQNQTNQDQGKATGSGVAESLEALQKVRTGKYQKLEDDLTRFITAMSIGIMFISQQDALTVMERTPGVVGALVDVAEKDEKMYRVLSMLVIDNVYFNLGIQVSGLANDLLKNHGIDPLTIAGNTIAKIFGKKESGQDQQKSQPAMSVPVEQPVDRWNGVLSQ